jgi:uncharacterized protein YaiE (UPF0345 family)
MKQLLSLFLFLLPCLAWAQYPSNGNQKITLGEQTSADGLIFRGVASIDTVTATSKITRANKEDTSAFILLDTVTNLLWHYKIGSNGWIQAGGGTAVTTFSGGTTGLTPSTATSGAVTLGGTLAVANGGTGSATQNFVDLTNTQTVGGAKTFSSTVTGARFDPTSSSASGNGMFLPTTNTLGLSTAGLERMRVTSGFVEVRSGAEIRYMNDANNDWGLIKFAIGGLNLGGINIQNSGGINSMYPITDNVTDLGTSSRFYKNGFINNLSIGISSTARLHIASGTATANTAPLKFTSGTNLTTAEAGAMEFNGTNLFFSPSTTRHTVNHGLTGSATLNFPSTTTLLSADLTITVTGAADGDVVSLGVPNAAVNANTSYSAWVSAANTVTVRFNNYSSGTVDPASALFKVFVTK